jgi:cyclic beta-1,2-glucan synthetase
MTNTAIENRPEVVANPPGHQGISWGSDEPIRAQLFSVEHLDEHARQLAAAGTSSVRRGVPLLRRFHENRRELVRAHRLVTNACRGQEMVGTDAEWFIDNFHIIEDALREVNVDLPRGYYSELPKLDSGPLAGLPRVYAIAIELLAHTDSGLDEASITRFVQSYQSITPLTIGELWAVPIMLRLGVIENLRRLGLQMVVTWQDRCRADSSFHRLCGMPEEAEKPDDSLPAGARLARKCAVALSRVLPFSRHNGSSDSVSDPFVVRLLTKLRDFGPGSETGVDWLEQRLAQIGISSADVMQRENQRQAANQVTVGNCVTSLRLLSALDWAAFFERTSVVEGILREDPAGVYSHQDFATKDRYRQVVERLARGSGHDELSVAHRVVAAAHVAEPDERQSHVGYHLIDRGRKAIQSELGFRPAVRERLLDWVLDNPNATYFGGIIIGMAVLLGALITYLWHQGSPALLTALAGVLALIPVSEVAVGCVNYVVTVFLRPRVLPKLELRDGIPPSAATFVVIPSMLLDRHSAANLAERLEVHYLANPDAQLRFALLTDFADAKTQEMPEDATYLEQASAAIRELNERYGEGTERFFLFQRRRLWNPVQGCWMGWERKRGKLLEFLRLLRGNSDTSFSHCSSDVRQLSNIRYCITLDADTVLPRDTARRLVGIISHPLNRPRFDPMRRRVVEGYGILQPRVSFGITAASRSPFSRILCRSAGIDPYTTAVSDVYHDLFGVGSYTGKGIFDVAAFQSAVGETFPQNAILSHDLIEGNYARCGLVSDVEFLDEFPSRYDAYARREHRWVRGDWQILPWLFRWTPSPEPAGRPIDGNRDSGGDNQTVARSEVATPVPTVGPAEPHAYTLNPLTAIARWKIFDNLRRSTVAPSLVLLAAVGWMALPVPWFWTTVVLLVVALPLLVRTASSLLGVLWRAEVRHPWRELRGEWSGTALQVALSVVFLLDQSRHVVNAVSRTLWRLFVTRRRLLEWESAAATEKKLGRGVAVREMWPVSGVAALIAAAVTIVRPDALAASLPLLIAWFASPALAWWVSRPLVFAPQPLSESERRNIRRIARRTWAFFETFVNDTEHWLPPDNFQEDPRGVVAHRTSPTNMGMLLLSTVAAHDLGYISLSEMLDRLERTFDTFTKLDRFHGHFFNWYDTETLRPLPLTYVSTVDSGNMLGCLLALKQVLQEKYEQQPKLPSPASREGFIDTLQQVTEALRAMEPAQHSTSSGTFDAIEQAVADLAEQMKDSPADYSEWDRWLTELERGTATLLSQVRAFADAIDAVPEELIRWTDCLASDVGKHRSELSELMQAGAGRIWDRCRRLADLADHLAREMNFRFLYNERRNLFAVGFNVALGRLDNAHYDLLASEAALTSLLAIARGEASQKHWFQLGRPLTSFGQSVVLVSWGGTMFEYLMPRLLLRTYPGTLLDESQRAAVARQIQYGRQRGVPWGISESGFSALDRARDYQYQSFGVPGIGLKRGLADELVVAPYATALALVVNPQEAVRNFRKLADEGAEGPFGFYEAIDYTRERLPDRQRSLVVRSFMAHHQGMSLVAMANCLLGDVMTRRFHADPIVRAVDLLLQERVPRAPALIQPHSDEASATPPIQEGPHPMSRRLTTADTQYPRTHLISNGRYNVMVSNAGAGSATCRGIDVTRWREDRTRDCWGQFIYIHNVRDGLVWSAAHQPICRPADGYEVIYSADKAEFRRLDGPIGTNLDIVVPPEDLAEIRRITLINHDDRSHRFDVTSYAELALLSHGADLAHPAFGKLFLETEYVAAHDALLCRRRPRRDDEKPIWAVHVVALDTAPVGDLEFETDRARFIGRGRTVADPVALDRDAILSGTTGAVLDPIFSLRRRVRVRPGASVSLAFTTAIADSREEALAIADRYHDYHAALRAFELAWAHSQVELRHLQLTGEEAHLFQRLATQLVFVGSTLRPPPAVLAANHQGQSALWRYGISGDKPILLVRISDVDDIATISRLLTAHTYFRLKGLEADLVVLCEEATTYFEELYQQVQQLVRTSDAHAWVDVPGGVFVRKATQMPDEDRILVQAAARVVLLAGRSLASQIDSVERPRSLPPRLRGDRGHKQWRKSTDHEEPQPNESAKPADLLFWNGIGGFTRDGREYVIHQGEPGRRTPMPWVNVIANRSFGFLISESGSGFTWCGNSQTNRLTPWNNDPVCDLPGEAIYVRDEASGQVWTPTPSPAAAPCDYVVRHGQGYSIFESTCDGLAQTLTVLVPPSDPVKLISLTVRNTSWRRRRLSATYYAEWVLGTVRDQTAMHVITEMDAPSGALTARNPFNQEFATRVAFADVNLRPRTFTADRTEFLGRNGFAHAPAGLHREELSNCAGTHYDPCAAIQVPFELKPGEQREIVFLLGQAESVDAMRNIVERFREPGAVDDAMRDIREEWDRRLGTVTVRTPNPAFDLLLNGWLLYQVLSCRVWGRSGLYQSSGAFGFRDQLQDVMAVVYGSPDETRAHILLAASRQFSEGDVQHWWHPPLGRGVRTRCSDDYLWLPFVVNHYVATTGDREILRESVPFLQAPILRPEQEEDYRLPDSSNDTAPLYEHCVRAVEHALQFGEHGLPLIGTCDWNDGYNRVGHGGRGESVWNAWFLIMNLDSMATLAESHGDAKRAARYRDVVGRLRAAVEQHAWDGHWYVRAFFDDGTPLGSLRSDECQIDSLAQTWSVISGAAEPQRAAEAMESVYERLVQTGGRLIRLFTPPFQGGTLQPGYVKGYVPGIRENGGQYTHAAAWVVQATATLGHGDRALELFDMINPIRHATRPEDVARYRVEPYVVAADIYSEPPHVGRGGWTWYTGSASWLYRVALEVILGFRLRGDRLTINPCISSSWKQFELTYRYRTATYHIVVHNPNGRQRGFDVVSEDGQRLESTTIVLRDDGRRHEIEVLAGE